MLSVDIKCHLQHSGRVHQASTACIIQCLSLISELAAAGRQLLTSSEGIKEIQPGYDVISGLYFSVSTDDVSSCLQAVAPFTEQGKAIVVTD